MLCMESLPALVPGSIMGAFDLQERWSDGENRNKKFFLPHSLSACSRWKKLGSQGMV